MDHRAPGPPLRRAEAAARETRYRKGLVLGLTIAEAMLLLLFALLLALSLILGTRDRELRSLQAQIASLEQGRAVLAAKVEVLQDLARGKPPDEFFTELVRARAAAQAAARREAELVQREKALERREALTEALTGSADRQARLRELAALGQRLETTLAKAPPAARRDAYELLPQAVTLASAARSAGQDVEEARTRLTQAARSAREIATYQGQVVRLRSELAALGRGADYPPCWVTRDGRIEFLLRVRLLASGRLQVASAAPPDRAADLVRLRLAPELFGTLAPARFLALTQGPYEQSRIASCRHWVMVADATGPAQKALYKRLLATVEAHFYKALQG